MRRGSCLTTVLSRCRAPYRDRHRRTLCLRFVAEGRGAGIERAEQARELQRSGAVLLETGCQRCRVGRSGRPEAAEAASPDARAQASAPGSGDGAQAGHAVPPQEDRRCPAPYTPGRPSTQGRLAFAPRGRPSAPRAADRDRSGNPAARNPRARGPRSGSRCRGSAGTPGGRRPLRRTRPKQRSYAIPGCLRWSHMRRSSRGTSTPPGSPGSCLHPRGW